MLLAGAVSVAGCAKPKGVLFPQIEPPITWPGGAERARIKLVGTISESRDLSAAESGTEIFKAALRGPRPPIRFSGPHDVAIREPYSIAIADASGGAVHLIDLDTREHTMVTGFGEERFAAPVGVAWAGDRLFVSDAERGEIVKLDASGGFVSRFGQSDLQRPVGIAYVASRDRLYVVDGAANSIKVFSPDGALERTIGRRGSSPGEFNFPAHICAVGDRIAVSDAGNFRVQLLTLDGESIGTIGRMGDAAGDLALPKGVAFDSDGHVYVVDARFENVQIFDEQGRLLLAFGEEGDGLGQFSLPAGIAIDAEDRIWVADAGNRRLQVFSYLRASS